MKTSTYDETRWKLVPVEPTETMVVSGFESAPDKHFSTAEEWERYEAMSGCQQSAYRAEKCWAAMLAAAPTTPADGQDNIIITENGGVQLNTNSPEVANKLFALIDQFRAVRSADVRPDCKSAAQVCRSMAANTMAECFEKAADGEAQQDADKVDAERYRWLKECNGGPIGIIAWHRDEEKEMILVESHADIAIDAARATAKGEM